MSRFSNQKGMMLIELVIGGSIAAAISAGLGFAVFQMLTVTDRSNDVISTVHDVQSAVYQISYDAKMAGSTDLVEGNPATDDVLLDWIDGGGSAYFSRYYLSGTELLRDYNGSVTTVARYISSVEFTISGSNLNYSIESSTGHLDTKESFSGTVLLRAMP